VNHQNCAGLMRDHAFYSCRRGAQTVGVDVNENGPCAKSDDRAWTRNPRKPREDNFVSWPNVKGL